MALKALYNWNNAGSLGAELVNGWNATLSGSPTQAPGSPGKSILLDGSSQHAYYTDNPLNFTNADTNNGTIIVRIKLGASGGGCCIFVTRTFTSPNKRYFFRVVSTAANSANAFNRGSLSGLSTLTEGTWNTIVLVVDGSASPDANQLWVNGKKFITSGDDNAASTGSETKGLVIGVAWYASGSYGNYFKGNIGINEFYDAVLPDAMIKNKHSFYIGFF